MNPTLLEFSVFMTAGLEVKDEMPQGLGSCVERGW